MLRQVDCSPRTRGWSRQPVAPHLGTQLLPAHAGMVPPGQEPFGRVSSAPRARGDGPVGVHETGEKPGCSPRTRGWSHSSALAHRKRNLLPAHAGMVPVNWTQAGAVRPAPRARGDGPPEFAEKRFVRTCSPRTRGWSQAHQTADSFQALLPAHAGMVPAHTLTYNDFPPAPRARGDGPSIQDYHMDVRGCSPRTRGWSPAPRDGRQPAGLLPAHAGMVPASTNRAYMLIAAPRARGDGPTTASSTMIRSDCSPRTRGWSHRPVSGGRCSSLLPAHAGMVPPRPSSTPGATAAPRARGDGPRFTVAGQRFSACSPRTRGWSRLSPPPVRVGGLLPAHAGMVPLHDLVRQTVSPAPRARGDGPRQQTGATPGMGCSPRTRGWSPAAAVPGGDAGLLPTHAGMVQLRSWPDPDVRLAPRECGD